MVDDSYDREFYPFHGDKVMRLYHQTNKSAADAIGRTKVMLSGSGGLYGGGIYFSESIQGTHKHAQHKGYMIVADVIVGNSKVVTSTGHYNFLKLHKSGYDSVYATNMRVVYNSDQVKIIDIYKIQ